MPKRSLRALANNYVKQKRYKTDTTALNQLAKWSREFEWQSRIVSAVGERSRLKLERSEELNADTNLKAAERLNDIVSSPGHIDPNTLIRIMDATRKPESKSTIDVKHSGTIKHAHHDMSAFTDEEIDTLAEIAERQKAAAGV